MTAKEQFIEELRKAGFPADYDTGVPVVFVNAPEEQEPTMRKINDLAKKLGYNESRGVKVKRGERGVAQPVQENPSDMLSVDDHTGGEPEKGDGYAIYEDSGGQVSLFT